MFPSCTHQGLILKNYKAYNNIMRYNWFWAPYFQKLPFNRDAYLRPRIVLLGCLEPEADWILVKELVHTLPSLVQDKCPNFRWTHRVSTPFKHSGNCENSLTALSSSQQAAVQPVPAPSSQCLQSQLSGTLSGVCLFSKWCHYIHISNQR